jgi:hypothetical protein
MLPEAKAAADAFKPGQQVTLLCTGDGLFMDTVALTKCTVSH